MTKRGMVGIAIVAGLIGLLVMGLVSTLIDPRYGRTCTEVAGRVLFKGDNVLALLAGGDGLVFMVFGTLYSDNFGDPSKSHTSYPPDLSRVVPGAAVVVRSPQMGGGSGCDSTVLLPTDATVRELPPNGSPSRFLLSAVLGLGAAGLFLFLVRRRLAAG